MDYKSKLKNPKWQKKRLEILNRDNFTCRYCKDEETELQIHHLKYTKKMPHLEPSDNLITLCADCHTLISKNNFSEILFIEKVVYENIKFFFIRVSEGTYFIGDGEEIAFKIGSKLLQRLYEINNISTENYGK